MRADHRRLRLSINVDKNRAVYGLARQIRPERANTKRMSRGIQMDCLNGALWERVALIHLIFLAVSLKMPTS